MSRRTKKQNITALVYDRRGRLLSVAQNSYVKTHPLMARHAKALGKPGAIFLHAEVYALIKARYFGIPFRIVVIRQGAKGTLLAKPCAICQRVIEEFHVRYVEHT